MARRLGGSRSIAVGLVGALVVVGSLVWLVQATCNPSMDKQNQVDIAAAMLPNPATTIRVWHAGLLVLSSEAERLSLLDYTGKLVHSVKTGRAPTMLYSLGVDNDVWITNAGDGTVTRVRYDDSRDGASKWRGVTTISIGGEPASIAIEPEAHDGGIAKRVFVAEAAESKVVVIDGRTNRIARQFQVSDPPSTSIWEENRLVLASSSRGTWGCVNPTLQQSMAILNMSGRISSLAETYNQATQRYGVAALFPDEGIVGVIDPQKCVIRFKLDVGKGATGLTTLTDESSFYVLNPAIGNVTAVKVDELDRSHGISVEPGAISLTVEPVSGLWVGYSDGRVVRLGTTGVPRAVFRLSFPPAMMGAIPDNIWAVGSDRRAAHIYLHYVYP